ncbi:MAG: hypothetical protein K0R67_3386 [Paenibacillus sp.]|nr:hypothetical protein [Paenibacillus sp.]
MPFLDAWSLRAEAAYAFTGGGNGSLGNPYVILKAEDLDNIRDSTLLSKHYKLGADIDLSSIANWVPIGTSSSPFGGNFDGGHYTISNLTIDSSLAYVGLFGVVASVTGGTLKTTIKNIRLENVNITSRGSSAQVGGLAGLIHSWASVDGVSVSGSITGVGAGFTAGGLAGQTNDLVSNSDTHVRVYGDFFMAGGIAGYSNYPITQSYATGDVTVTGNGNKAGGLIGDKAGELSNSYATGRIEAINPTSSVGGLIGNYGHTITNSYASGTLIKAAGSGHIGGMIGYPDPSLTNITNSYWNSTDNPGLSTLGTMPGMDEAVQKSDMKNMITLGGWSSTIWGIQEGISTPYLKTFSPVLRVAPILTTYYTEPTDNVLQVSGHVRDGSIGEPLKISIVITNNTDATVTGYVYEMQATGDVETFDWQTPIDEQRYPEGTYTLSITVEDTITGHEQQQSFSFDVQDITAPTAVVSSTGGGAVNAPFPVTITFSEAVQGFTENDMVIENGTVSDLVTVTSTTYSATVSPTTSGQAVKVTVAAGAVTDAAGNANPQSNTLLVQYDTTRPAAVFGNFTHGQLFNVPPAAVTVSVSEAVYWIAGGAELDAANALPLIGMKMDGAAFTAYTASFDALTHTFTLSFNSPPQDGVYEVEAAGNVVRNVYHNILDAAHASFTVDTHPPVITLVGGASIDLTAGDPFVDPGATAADSFEGNIAFSVTGSVDNQVPGTYTLKYEAQDSAGNAAVPVTRTIRVNARSTESGSVQQSSNANLNQLTVKANGEELKLSPIFAPDTTSYRVTTSADEVSIEAVLSDAKATVTLGEGTLIGGTTVALTKGDNVFELIVKAENGTVKSYSLTIQRQTELVPLPTEGPTCTFRDIKDHWAEHHICEAAEKGIVTGNSTTEFAPQGLVTRVEFAALLLRTLGATPGPAADKLVFTDQDQIPTWATTSVSDAVEIGILQGYPDGSLRPMHTVSRSEMATMMVRVMKWDIAQGQMTSFTDDADIPNWARGYIYTAVERGLLNGREGNQFSPSQPATRAEAATILLRLWHVIDDMRGK